LEESFDVVDVPDDSPALEDELDDVDEEELLSEPVPDLASDPDEDLFPDSLLRAFFRASDG
jgi:hypothetical protein